MIHWPCILKLAGDDELIFIKNHDAFIADCGDMILQNEDRLIDSQGITFSIENTTSSLTLRPTDVKIDAAQASTLIQEHEFANAQVCIIKMHFTSVAQAIKAIEN